MDVASGKTKRLMIQMPPRSGKSELVSKYFPAWYLGTHPKKRIILSTYGADFASEWGRKARDVLAEWGPQLYGVQVSEDSSAAYRWDIKGKPGGMNTAGVGGDITGKGAHILIIDDPVKNAQEANSRTMRNAVWEWFRSTAYTRLTPDGRIILVMTRWHHDDLAGRLLKAAREGGEQWEVIKLPAIAQDTDILGRMPGQALWPEYGFTVERYDQIKQMVGSQIWAALYQQEPSPDVGATYKRTYFAHTYRELPKLAYNILSIDSAFKEGVANDYSVIAAWGRTDTDYYVRNVWRDRVDFPGLINAIQQQAALYQPDAIYIEDAASGQSAIQWLRTNTRLPIVAVTPQGSKLSRADAISPIFEAGKVWLPDLAFFPDAGIWLGEWIEEHIAFPKGVHDDQCDTTSQALTKMRQPLYAESVDNVLDRETSPNYMPQDIWG